MVVLRIIGDEWKFGEKIALSMPPSKTFHMVTTQLREKLQIPTFQGCALYFTEGKPPSYVRATIPVPMQSTPGKEGMKDGCLLFVKTRCDAARQERDRVFQSALEDWRKAMGITAILSDGSDVLDFLDEFSKRLNPEDAKDINEHESELRHRIAGEESRAYFVVTFEYREIQQMKDEETAKRQDIMESWLQLAMELFERGLAAPRRQWQRACLCSSEAAARLAITTLYDAFVGNEGSSAKSAFFSRYQQMLQAAETSSAAAIVSKLPALTTNTASYAAEGQGVSVAMLPVTLEREIADLKRLMSVLLEGQVEAKRSLAQAYEVANAGTEQRYKLFMESVIRTSNDLAERDARLPLGAEEERLLRERRSLLQALLDAEERDADDAHWQLLRTKFESLSRTTSNATADFEAFRDVVDLRVRERNAFASALQQATAENARLATHLTLFESIVEDQAQELQHVSAWIAETHEKRRGGAIQRGGCDISSHGRWQRAHTGYPATCGLHPDVYALLIRVVEMHEPIPTTLSQSVIGYSPERRWEARDVDPLSRQERCSRDEDLVRSSAEARHYFRSVVEELSLRCGADVCQTADEVCFRYGLSSHVMRGRFLRVLDDEMPHLAGAVDILLEVYAEREAELMVNLTQRHGATVNFVAYEDPVTGSTYYYHAGVDMTQWRRPAGDLEFMR